MAQLPRTEAARLVYTLPELAAVSAIDYRTLHNWQKRGILKPSHQAANGSGTVNLFDETDALQILVLAELRAAGVEVRVLERIADQIHDLASTVNEEQLIVISGHGVAVRSPRELHSTISPEEPTVVVGLGSVRRALAGLARAA